MPVILRVDVDNAYSTTSLNYLKLNWYFPNIGKLGYLKHLKDLIQNLDDRGVGATFFFKTKTIPDQVSLLNKHELGLHVVYANDYEAFKRELTHVSKKIGTTLRGFSKHGSGTIKLARRHYWQYTPEVYIEWANRAHLDYFSGNRTDPAEPPVKYNSITYFPSAFWVNEIYREKKFDIKWLVEFSTNNQVVVLVHPLNWAVNPRVRKGFENIMNKIDKFSFYPS